MPGTEDVEVYRKKRVQSASKGSAIALVLLVIVILLAAGTGLLSLGLHSRVFAIRDASGIAARCAVDAGLTKALFEMNEKLKVKPWDGSTLPQATDERLPNCDAIFSYAVTGDIDSGYIIESIGKSNQAERRVIASLQLQGPFEYTLFVQESAILRAKTLVDGYNSLDPDDTDVEVRIGTSSTLPDSIILNLGVIVNGDVFVGVGGDIESVIRDLGATVNDRYAVSVETVFPDITVPALPDKDTEIDIHGTTLTISPADNGEYDEIELKRAVNPGILKIDGGDVVLYVTGDISLGQDCEIRINQGASLTLYLDGDFDAGNDAGINNGNSPVNFKLYGTGEGVQEFDLKAKGDFFGAVYAPNADITINAGGDIYGSFVGSDFEMKSGGNLYYDEALRSVSVDDEAVRFVVDRWSEQ
jgi:hypothetical protein